MSTVKTGIPLHTMPNFLTSISIALSNRYCFTSQEWDRPGWADICYKLLELLKDRPLIFKTI